MVKNKQLTLKTAEAQANRAEFAATEEAMAREEAEAQANRAELAATQEAIARQGAEAPRIAHQANSVRSCRRASPNGQ